MVRKVTKLGSNGLKFRCADGLPKVFGGLPFRHVYVGKLGLRENVMKTASSLRLEKDVLWGLYFGEDACE